MFNYQDNMVSVYYRCYTLYLIQLIRIIYPMLVKMLMVSECLNKTLVNSYTQNNIMSCRNLAGGSFNSDD
jgi:hypothetical protein